MIKIKDLGISEFHSNFQYIIEINQDLTYKEKHLKQHVENSIKNVWKGSEYWIFDCINKKGKITIFVLSENFTLQITRTYNQNYGLYVTYSLDHEFSEIYLELHRVAIKNILKETLNKWIEDEKK